MIGPLPGGDAVDRPASTDGASGAPLADEVEARDQPGATQDPSTMALFVARQPIFTPRLQVHAYELLFRSGPENLFPDTDCSQASAELIVGSLATMGLDQLTGGKPAFINFTRELLVNDYFTVLPVERVVVELLENAGTDEAVLSACRRLKSSGRKLALDDVHSLTRIEALIDIADIVKIDFRRTSPRVRRGLARELTDSHVKLVAEKVETQEEFLEALEMGFHYFQGYFLKRPAMVSGREVPGSKLALIELLRAAYSPDFDFGRLEEVIKRDLSLSYKTLRFANSAAMGRRERIKSIRHALVMLGQEDVVRLISLMALAGLSSDKPEELAVTSVIRAGFLEALAPIVNFADESLDLFLIGMFSLIDVLMDLPMDEAAARLPASELVIATLTGQPGVPRDLLELAKVYERADWPEVTRLAERWAIPLAEVPKHYLSAVGRSDDIFAAGERTAA